MTAVALSVSVEPGAAAQVGDLLNLVVAIRENLEAAGIGPFCDVPELAKAYSIARSASALAEGIAAARRRAAQ